MEKLDPKEWKCVLCRSEEYKKWQCYQSKGGYHFHVCGDCEPEFNDPSCSKVRMENPDGFLGKIKQFINKTVH